jgi:hypothetical protein
MGMIALDNELLKANCINERTGEHLKFIDVVESVFYNSVMQRKDIGYHVAGEMQRLTNSENFKEEKFSLAVTHALQKLRKQGKVISHGSGAWKKILDEEAGTDYFNNICPSCKSKVNNIPFDKIWSFTMKDYVKGGIVSITPSDIIRNYIDKEYKNIENNKLNDLYNYVTYEMGDGNVERIKNFYTKKKSDMPPDVIKAFCKVLEIEFDYNVICMALKYEKVLKALIN